MSGCFWRLKFVAIYRMVRFWAMKTRERKGKSSLLEGLQSSRYRGARKTEKEKLLIRLSLKDCRRTFF